MAERRLRIGVVGAGHFGRFHAQKAVAGARTTLIGLHDADPARAALVAGEVGVPALSLEEVLAGAEAVIIAAPADAHHGIASRALQQGRHVLVEKPIAASLAQADALAALAAASGLVLQVGHLERFSAAYQAVTERMVRPLYIEATRIAPFKPRGTDVSVILDLMIHDLDLVLALVDSPLEHVEAVGAPVASEFEDIANARLRFANGSVAGITASRISMKTERRMRIFGRNSYLTVDFVARRLVAVGQGEGGMPVPGVPGFSVRESSWQDHDSLAAEQAAFAASVLDGAPVLVDAAAGRRALAAALAVGTAMAESRERLLRSGFIDR